VRRRRCPARTGRDRSFFAVTPRRDEPGSLVRLLQEFSVRGINLTTIESRPTRALLGEYRFLIECEGHVADAHVRDAVLGLLRFPGETRFLGSFPEDPARRGHAPAPAEPPEAVMGYERMLDQVES
jgi:prephenate dehydratase